MAENKVVPKLRFGEFKEGWVLKILGDVGELINGLTYSPNDITDDGILVLRSSNVQNNQLAFNDNVYVNVKSFNPVKENDILICVRNGSKRLIGKNCLIDKTNEGVAFGAFMTVYRSINNKFILHLFSLSSYYKTIHQNLGATINSINNNDLRKFKFFFPPLPEQQKIASFLSAVDEKLQQLTKKQELLAAYKKGVMQKIFSQELRFKSDNGNNYPDWEERKVEDLFIVTRGTVLAIPKISPHKNDECPYPVYSSQTKNNGIAGYYKESLFEDAITWTTDGAQAGEVNFRKGKFYCTNVCGVLKSDEGYANLCIAEKINRVSRRYVSYVGNPKLMNNVMAKIKISVPASLGEQQKIANFLSSLDSKIDLVSTQIENTKAFKKGLLQQMFV
ncbi:restriction endonuclease subunit S [Flavobacteriales bacterium]|nr:restriction endonuclease subunit S [Flavobacteriales bacterium]